MFDKCTHHSVDKRNATNNNTTFCTVNIIVTNFEPVGKQKAAHADQLKTMRGALNMDRGTRLEGSFDNEKNHYQLNKINAPNAVTEKYKIVSFLVKHFYKIYSLKHLEEHTI